MRWEIVARYNARVPRYTSYPTAPHFHGGVDGATLAGWLGEVSPDQSLSVYLHIPFCDTLCWFCGCHTRITRRYGPVAEYLALAKREVELVSDALGGRRPVRHLHWGGGSPTILRPEDVVGLARHIRNHFDVAADAEFGIEIDPRDLPRETVAAMAEAGVTRASLGVQDLDPAIQAKINRIQPFEETEAVVGWLRQAGIVAINVDLMYGLPEQTSASVLASLDAVLTLKPGRLALFGYAHVPWMKSHQRLIDEASLPSAPERLSQFLAASERLAGAGYEPIGLDHWALPDDSLARAKRGGRLKRNFMGYTDDQASALIGLGASAISDLPQGYAQNQVPIRAYRDAIQSGQLATVRGIAVSADDRLRRAVIERLMCDLGADLAAIANDFGREPAYFAAEIVSLRAMQKDGVVELDGWQVRVTDDARALLRSVCAVFDRALGQGGARHAGAV